MRGGEFVAPRAAQRRCQGKGAAQSGEAGQGGEGVPRKRENRALLSQSPFPCPSA